jgi:hypothetical protein
MIASIKFVWFFPAEMGIFNSPHLALPYCCHFKIIFSHCNRSMMANEYSYGTLKQNLIDGLSKGVHFV